MRYLTCLFLFGCTGGFVREPSLSREPSSTSMGNDTVNVHLPTQMSGLNELWFFQTLGENQSSAFCFRSRSMGTGWLYLECHSGGFFIDGEQYPLEMVHDGTVVSCSSHGCSCYETACVYDLSDEIVQKLAHASVASFSICNEESYFSPEDKQTLRRYISIQ